MLELIDELIHHKDNNSFFYKDLNYYNGYLQFKLL